MKIDKDAVVRLSIELVSEEGTAPAQELTYLHGGYGNLFPKVEAALAGLEPGASTSVKLAPADSFGERDPALVRTEPLARLPEGVAIGSALRGEADEDGHVRAFRVTALSDTEATLDGNHPLAGRTVELRLAVLEVRAATGEEIAHGHVHGPGEHAH